MFDSIINLLIKGFEGLHNVVFNIIPNVNLSYGLTIILAIIIIKVITLPLHIKQVKTTKVLQKIQPELQKIQAKYKSDPQKQQQQILQLYKDYKINPLSGCLPTFIQLPILLLFFQLFLRLPGLQENTISFLWIPNLATKDPYFILPILAVITGFLQGKLSIPTPVSEDSKTQAQQSRIMNIVLSVMLGVFTISVSSAVGIYYVFSNIISIIISVIINNVFRNNDKVILKN
ncbi:stage III sporulation protein J [Candidatus Arthromitus sp. SFB-mouse-Japan]|uniref:membrane protein insertase YidC n=1 Tax=Candidatus Arthromitus sp. SFB-mouse TaxID=49118 RepID=UPI00021B81C4|nr:membrane protein insertase YidC [Candidatus Arthromitus sp. SFB-mouse]EIA22789.1 Sporulation associated-membrane protein [Candidatus Arthromitus sp. SFB-2]EIA23844.1 Putative sporulation associated-membrane protein [Candidatus Arthromitus sp. SFB-3]EIA23938.1 Sporulation associated-membrane protein [Candidatus Arthromitus sp. SFB-1]EIA28926.1 Sporulation associated-membrane protein [Candidatus Arthromitus sp. SFB-co]EIA28986.1 Sporulation associated-membrane protein [Candidatus Arthromitus 